MSLTHPRFSLPPPNSICYSLASDQTAKLSLLKGDFSKEPPCHKLTRSSGLLLRPNPRQRGAGTAPHSGTSIPRFTVTSTTVWPLWQNIYAQIPKTSVKIPTSLHRAEYITGWCGGSPLAQGQRSVHASHGLPPHVLTPVKHYKGAHSTIPAWHQDRIYQTASAFGK